MLRGPQGTLFGRNTIAGAVNIVYNKPVNRLAASAYLDAGRYDTFKGHAMANVPIVDDRLLLRANLSYGRSDGFIRDIGPAKNRDDYDKISGRIALRALFGPLTIDASYAASRYRSGDPVQRLDRRCQRPGRGCRHRHGYRQRPGFLPEQQPQDRDQRADRIRLSLRHRDPAGCL